MESFRGKAYSFSPTCIFCGEHADEKQTIPANAGRYTSRFLVVPAHAACVKRRRVMAAIRILAAILVFGLLIPVLAGYLSLGMWGAGITLLSPVVGLPVSVLIVDAWLWGPRERFMREHGLK